MTNKTVNWDNNLSIRKVISLLQEGSVVVGPSDTVLGLYSQPTDQGFLSLNKIKKRSKKPYLLLIPVSFELNQYVESRYLLQVENIMAHFWPGPLTLIFKAKSTVPAYMTSSDSTIAVRMPKHDRVQQILAQTGPLFSTSANLTGEPIPTTLSELNPIIKQQASTLIVGASNHQSLPSTILDTTKEPFVIVREGAYSKEELNPFMLKK
ncbi:MAG: L-threonylcarbamoyladenylate synthase [Alteromonas naphthalenivorans]|jgi:L-threonylcarbamoyladenylate synthase